MTRRLFAIASALSLLLFVTVVVMWVRSRDYLDGYQRVGLYAASYQGRVHVIRETGQGWMLRNHTGFSSIWMTEPNVRRTMAEPWEDVWHTGTSKVTLSGLRYAHRAFPQINTTVAVLTVPYWMISTAAAILPSAFAIVWTTRRGRRRGLCPSCGYDLRATPERCPECGAAPGISCDAAGAHS